jgi:hypothetical protein
VPLVRATSNQNIRKVRKGRRSSKWINITGPSTAASPLALAATGTFNITGASTSNLVESINALRAFNRSEGSGRDARVTILATASLEMETFPLDPETAFVMIKRISPIMPNPLPLDSKGRPT